MFQYVQASDFNGDGMTDPAMYNASTHLLSWLDKMSGIWTNVDMGTGTYTLANGQSGYQDKQVDNQTERLQMTIK